MRIAIASPGVGRIRRGFEAFADDLFRHLTAQGAHEVVMFKGGGEAASSEVVLWNVPRASPVWRVPGWFVNPYIGEELTFALSLARRLKKESFDIVHMSDCQLASMVAHFTHGRAGRARILFSNGGPHPPGAYRRFDFVQQVNPVAMANALAYGIDPDRMMLVPYAVRVDGSRPVRDIAVRRELQIPDDAFLVLSVGTHGAHKRLDFLVRAIAEADIDVHLLIAGQPSPEDAELKRIAATSLGGRVSFASYPHGRMPRVYGAADLYAHAALGEGLGLALLEAMACGLPVLHHDEPGMNWLVDDGGVAVNMTDMRAFGEVVRSIVADPSLRHRLSQQARRRAEAFSWDALLPSYSIMYERAARVSPDAWRG